MCSPINVFRAAVHFMACANICSGPGHYSAAAVGSKLELLRNATSGLERCRAQRLLSDPADPALF